VISSNLPGNCHSKQKARKQNNDVAHKQDPKQVIKNKMLEIGLGPSNKPSVTRVFKKASFSV
jgi:hypothetical protein